MKKWESDVIEWEKRNNNFLQKQTDFNAKIDQMKESYLSKNNDSIIEYCEMVLNNSEYPDSFPQNFELEYNPDNKNQTIFCAFGIHSYFCTSPFSYETTGMYGCNIQHGI